MPRSRTRASEEKKIEDRGERRITLKNSWGMKFGGGLKARGKRVRAANAQEAVRDDRAPAAAAAESGDMAGGEKLENFAFLRLRECERERESLFSSLSVYSNERCWRLVPRDGLGKCLWAVWKRAVDVSVLRSCSKLTIFLFQTTDYFQQQKRTCPYRL